MTSVEGGCHCGAVRYECSADPIVGAHCHCTDCQKLSGSGHTFHLAFPKDAVKVSGEVKTYDHTADSGATVTTSFCANCGSPLLGRSSGMPDMVTVRATSLDDPNAFQPQMVVYTRSARTWDQVPPGLPAFEAMPPMEAAAN
jgi:hypothetical protein